MTTIFIPHTSIAVCMALILCHFLSPAGAEEKSKTLELVTPQIGIRQDDLAPVYGVMTYLWVRLPQVESEWNIFDMQMYEEPRDLQFLGRRKLDNGVLELRHRRRSEPYWIMITEITTSPGKIEMVARPELDPEIKEKHELPDELPELNVCCTFNRSRYAFDIIPDPFPEFSTRSFIFTEEGFTFLDKTVRRPLTRGGPDDPRTNPPWIQDYSPIWQPVHESTTDSWYNWSTDRYVLPVIGVVSRDRKHLVALASDTTERLAQAWGPCIHNYPPWLPLDGKPADRRWRMTLYAMPNDPDALLDAVREDYPESFTLQEARVP
ncbi:MAG: hypothetical protein O2955_14505 [Planctomycetota bacterium]|nr:hypothetical protein [Planctomycetota bacterium]MDA1213723.1 hypothetical protein [Planctomycetota bacterium]